MSRNIVVILKCFFVVLSLYMVYISNFISVCKNCTYLKPFLVSQIKAMPEKWISNPFEDYEIRNQYVDSEEKEILPEFVDKLNETAEHLLKKLYDGLSVIDRRDTSVYTGTSGIAYLFLHLGTIRQQPKYFKDAADLLPSGSGNFHRVTFLCGDAGPLALKAVLKENGNKKEKSMEYIQTLKQTADKVANDGDLPYECLYGKVGFLYSLLFINKHFGDKTIESSTIRKVVSAILDAGQSYSRKHRMNVPLMYEWHDKRYLGAAHGLAGILYLLLEAKDQLREDEIKNLIRPSIDYLGTSRYSSYNFPSSLGSESDRLVQWCHGAPGFISLFSLAYKTFGDEKYKKIALEGGELIWERGILKKGYSICHGVAGNAYAFLTLYRTTQDVKHLYRACCFADWCRSYGKFQEHKPDRPYSLFEGVSGVIYFLIDLQNPMNARFPGYEL